MAVDLDSDVIMGAMASQITSLAVVYSTVYSGADQRKHQNPASLAFVRGIPRWPMNSPHNGPVTRKMFPFDDVIMCSESLCRQDIANHDVDNVGQIPLSQKKITVMCTPHGIASMINEILTVNE